MVGGQAPKAIRSVECYDFEEGRWDQIAELPSRRCRAGKQPGQALTPMGSIQLFPSWPLPCGLLPSPFYLHTGAAYCEVSSYVLMSGICSNLATLEKQRRNQSPVVTHTYLNQEVAFHRESGLYPPCILDAIHQIRQSLPFSTLMSCFPVSQVWCSWLAMCMPWVGLTVLCGCGQWMCMMA